MTLKRTEELLKILKRYGVSHFKSLEVEIRFEAQPSSVQSSEQIRPAEHEIPIAASVGNTGAAVLPVESKIPHTLDKVASLLKLSDEELVDQLFPEPKPEKE